MITIEHINKVFNSYDEAIEFIKNLTAKELKKIFLKTGDGYVHIYNDGELLRAITVKFYKTKLKDNFVMPKGFTSVPMRGFNKYEDYYLLIPERGIYFRAANCSRYGVFKRELFIDGRFVGATPYYKMKNIIELYKRGHIEDAISYALGHMLYVETSLGGGKINIYKEAARLSHYICPFGSHQERQQIRRRLLEGCTIHGFCLK